MAPAPKRDRLLVLISTTCAWVCILVTIRPATEFVALRNTAPVKLRQPESPGRIAGLARHGGGESLRWPVALTHGRTGAGRHWPVAEARWGDLRSSLTRWPLVDHFIWRLVLGFIGATVLAACFWWAYPKPWKTTLLSSDQLSPRGYVRMYRILGLGEEASKEQVARATTRLRKKYAEDLQALDRVEMANLWIMTRMVSKKEEAQRARRKAEFVSGQSWRRWLQHNISSYIPPPLMRMVEMPGMKHFQRTSGLLGVFALLGLCAPSQATNFVGFGAASCLGLIYQRNRPEPVTDDLGNIGQVHRLSLKEMGATVALVIVSALAAAALSICQQSFLATPFQVVFCVNSCLVFWFAALFFKVYEVFDK